MPNGTFAANLTTAYCSEKYLFKMQFLHFVRQCATDLSRSFPNLCYLAFVDNWESSTLQLFQTVRLCNECLYPIRKIKVEMSKSANSRFEPEIEDDIEELGTG
ncbi:conserved hypothetical protein [Trichinella spiralis]|uniref:hypothetical protein n=1 Tax=Trichinella spiralis TaxID=6334 RepID=UPI0001EFDC2C|nr:conserved hypothetical protein [Trichinella spiralis]